MKALLLSCAVLVLLFLVGLGNSACLSARSDAWQRQLTAAETSVNDGDWSSAQTQLAAMHRAWEEAEPYLHTVLHHEEAEKALVLLSQCRLFATLEDEAALLSTTEQLRCQLRHMAEAEELRFINIF